MANAINLHELEQELTRTKNMFEQWSRTIVTSAEECKAAHLSKMRANKAELDALNERYSRAEKQAEQVRQQMAQDREQEQALQERADSLVAEQQQLQERLQKLQQELELEAETTQQTAADVASRRAEYELRVGKLDELHNLYEKCLGLTLTPLKERELLLEFTQIDPQEPCRPFSFAIQVVGNNDYEVTRCNPEIPGRQQLEEVLLKERKDFAGFVRVMRQQFVQLVAAAV